MVSVTGRDVITTGAGWMPPAGCTRSGWVLVMFTVGRAAGVGRGKTLIRAVSFLGPRLTEGATEDSSRPDVTDWVVASDSAGFPIPGGLGKGRSNGEVSGGGITKGRRGKAVDVSTVISVVDRGVIVGGSRRIDITGVLLGKEMRVVPGLVALGIEPVGSDLGGSAMRTVSFLGSAMG